MWVDAVGILSVWETDLHCTIIHLLGWRARANNAENLAEGILYAAVQIPSLITNFLPSSVGHSSRKIVFLYLSPQQIFKRQLISNCLKCNCCLLIYFTSDMFCENSPLPIFEWIALSFLPLGYRKPSIFAFEPYTHTHTLFWNLSSYLFRISSKCCAFWIKILTDRHFLIWHILNCQHS